MTAQLDINEKLEKLKKDNNIFNSRSIQLCKVINNEKSFHDLTNPELYAHVNALKLQLKSSIYQIDKEWTISKEIIQGWETLNNYIKQDDDLKHDWDSFMIIMKLKT